MKKEKGSCLQSIFISLRSLCCPIYPTKISSIFHSTVVYSDITKEKITSGKHHREDDGDWRNAGASGQSLGTSQAQPICITVYIALSGKIDLSIIRAYTCVHNGKDKYVYFYYGIYHSLESNTSVVVLMFQLSSIWNVEFVTRN